MTAVTTVPPTAPEATGESVITVRGLKKHFPIKEGVLQRVAGHVKAVDGVGFDVLRGTTVGLVGESGCGKSTLGRVISGLMEPTAGGVYFHLSGQQRQRLDALLALSPQERTSEHERELERIDAAHRIDRLSGEAWTAFRRNCQVVFQDSFASLNPRQLVKDIVGRPLRIHGEAHGTGLTERIVELLESVGLGRQHLYRYPHQFSGGQRQRISIARALALDPEFIVLDEPTSALDVSVQAQILNLLHTLQQERGLTYLFITHDLGVVRHMSDRIVVMYLGQIAEQGPSEDVFTGPRHPYTEALLAANPAFDEGDREPIRLAGSVPDPARPPQGCRFHTRCPVATTDCGWEVDDIVRQLERRPELFETLEDVERRSPFEARLRFRTPDHAASLVRSLAEAAPAMRDALETSVEDATVHVRFHEVAPVPLRAVADDHQSSCILHTGVDPTR